MDEVPLLVLAMITVIMLISSIVEGMGWLVPLAAPVGVVSAFLSLERER